MGEALITRRGGSGGVRKVCELTEYSVGSTTLTILFDSKGFVDVLEVGKRYRLRATVSGVSYDGYSNRIVTFEQIVHLNDTGEIEYAGGTCCMMKNGDGTIRSGWSGNSVIIEKISTGWRFKQENLTLSKAVLVSAGIYEMVEDMEEV